MKLIYTILLVILPSVVIAGNADKCPFKVKNTDSIIVGWITGEMTISQSSTSGMVKTVVGPFKPIAEIANNEIIESVGDTIVENQIFWPVLNLSKSAKLNSVGSFWNKTGTDHCVYFASIDNNDISKGTILISEPLVIFNEPSKQDKSVFNKLNKTCVDQGDYDEKEKPPCTKPQLLAVTDTNNDSKMEFWATEPYMWDTGLTVWEYDNYSMRRILHVCPACSD